MDELERAGAGVVIIGNGGASFARGFLEQVQIDAPLLVDPELVAYRAGGMRRGRVEALSPRVVTGALRAFRSGARQEGVQGDPWQLGGLLVLRPGGELVFEHRSRDASDQPDLDAVVAALQPEARPIREQAPGPSPLAPLARGVARVLDPTILLSFDRTGYRLHQVAFDPRDLDVDLTGLRCLVTGANSGIGLATAEALADLGARVELLCRSLERGQDAAERIRESTGSARVSVQQLDVSRLDDVRAVAAKLGDAPVDVLVHNAGVLPAERQESADGFEISFATHVLGPHLLTRALRPALERAEAARVIWVSSGGMYTQGLSLEDWQWRERDYDGVRAYAQTKRMQVVLSELWADQLRASGVRVNAMHPGWADTPSVQSSLPGFARLIGKRLRSPAEGADTVIWLAASGAAAEHSGEFFLDREPRSTHYLPWTREDEADRRALWSLCERLTG